jgi:hypothetical protein
VGDSSATAAAAGEAADDERRAAARNRNVPRPAMLGARNINKCGREVDFSLPIAAGGGKARP